MMEVTQLGLDSFPGLDSLRKHIPLREPITAVGDLEVLQSKMVALFCSVRCPGKLILATHDLCHELRNKGMTVVGGFHSRVERECQPH